MNKKQLEKLFNDLKINNFSLANGIEQKIWKIWSTHILTVKKL